MFFSPHVGIAFLAYHGRKAISHTRIYIICLKEHTIRYPLAPEPAEKRHQAGKGNHIRLAMLFNSPHGLFIPGQCRQEPILRDQRSFFPGLKELAEHRQGIARQFEAAAGQFRNPPAQANGQGCKKA